MTGDIGYMDEFGRVVINDRKKQLIKVRGYSVFPKEIEELVGNHPGVSEVAAAGLPDKDRGRGHQGMGDADPGIQGPDYPGRTAGLVQGEHDPLQSSAINRIY